MEQSPLSHSIRNLEAELRTKLFHRTTRRTWLTRAGLRFFADTRRILGEVDAAAISLRAESEDCPERVSLILGKDLAGEPFTRLLFESEHYRPSIVVEVRELCMKTAKLVRDGGTDFALTLDGQNVVAGLPMLAGSIGLAAGSPALAVGCAALAEFSLARPLTLVLAAAVDFTDLFGRKGLAAKSSATSER